MSEYMKFKTAVYRGGTSKGIIFRPDDLPKNPEERDKVILNIFGSPDVRQIDGLGGADSLTSKMAIIGPSEREDADVDYTFGQVSILAPKIDYSGNCGNISSAVGPYAIDCGMVKAVSPITKVRIFNTNTNKIIEAEVPVENGETKIDGDTTIDGVPGTGAPVILNFLDSAGAVTGKLLPSGKVKEEVQTSVAVRTVSFVDSANPLIFINARDLGFRGNELPEELMQNKKAMDELEEIRGLYAVRMNLVDKWQDAKIVSPGIPKICMVSVPDDYVTITGKPIDKKKINIIGRIMSMQKPHKAFAVTGAICLGTAAKIPGTIVNDLVEERENDGGNVCIGHPSGTIKVNISIDTDTEGGIHVRKAALVRTARRLMEGVSYIRKSNLSHTELL